MKITTNLEVHGGSSFIKIVNISKLNYLLVDLYIASLVMSQGIFNLNCPDFN